MAAKLSQSFDTNIGSGDCGLGLGRSSEGTSRLLVKPSITPMHCRDYGGRICPISLDFSSLRRQSAASTETFPMAQSVGNPGWPIGTVDIRSGGFISACSSSGSRGGCWQKGSRDNDSFGFPLGHFAAIGHNCQCRVAAATCSPTTPYCPRTLPHHHQKQELRLITAMILGPWPSSRVLTFGFRPSSS